LIDRWIVLVAEVSPGCVLGSPPPEVPAEYTRSAYPLQYSFDVAVETGAASWPGLGDDLAQRPYFVSDPA
jgi:hypothetical protein